MSLPTIAVVGRPNVGKSTLFNRIAGERISIVEDVEGVTRDRIYATGEWLNRSFSMIETGGIDDVDAPFMEPIKLNLMTSGFSSSYSFGRFSTMASSTSPVPIPWTDEIGSGSPKPRA